MTLITLNFKSPQSFLHSEHWNTLAKKLTSFPEDFSKKPTFFQEINQLILYIGQQLWARSCEGYKDKEDEEGIIPELKAIAA